METGQFQMEEIIALREKVESLLDSPEELGYRPHEMLDYVRDVAEQLIKHTPGFTPEIALMQIGAAFMALQDSTMEKMLNVCRADMTEDGVKEIGDLIDRLDVVLTLKLLHLQRTGTPYMNGSFSE